jgi:Cu-Zn family superoxide dismutase
MSTRNGIKLAGITGMSAMMALGLWVGDSLAGGSHTKAPASRPAAATASTVTKAIAVLHPTRGNNVHGTVTFTKVTGGIRVVANITGLKPGKHGFHVHEKGDCSAPDASSAGGHFNPTKMPHSAPDAAQRHVGDFGNLTADSTGRASYNRVDRHIAFSGIRSIIGRAVIVHANADDLKSQPSGDAGGRVACGVVGIVE